MKIFGINFETKKELRAENEELTYKIADLNLKVVELEDSLDCAIEKLNFINKMFPLELDQVVFDVALKNAQGKCTKKKPSLKHSTITEVTVNEKNYFSLVKKLKSNGVFFSKKDAEKFLKSVCK
jgi:hypothetical protein